MNPGEQDAWWQPWAALSLFAFLFNFVWEFLQVPAFEGLADEPHWSSILFCLQDTVGDVVILAIAYGAVTGVTGTRWWLTWPTVRRVSAYFAVGLAMTFVLASPSQSSSSDSASFRETGRLWPTVEVLTASSPARRWSDSEATVSGPTGWKKEWRSGRNGDSRWPPGAEKIRARNMGLTSGAPSA